ncbi:MAG TPA: IS66 family transposase [Streptosporangiaceae bacterium]|nr:IS66 family transposase [Streptosporangiaceae bacterium]
MPHLEQPPYEELAAQNAELTARVAELLAVVAEQAGLIESLRAEVAALRRQAGRDSSNSSQPPSQDGPAAEAKAKAARQAARRARPGRAQGGQKGHPGASLAWAARPDETLVIEPGTCAGCGADLAGAEGRVASAVQVFDIPPAALTVTEFRMMHRTCGCGQVTTAPAPAGVTGGPVCYGPNVTDAAALLASTDVIGIERAADLMGALLKAPVSTGFVSRCLARLDTALTAARFEDALKDALRAADVPGTDETPAPLTTAATSAEDCGNPHVYTVRTTRAYTGGGPDLIWYGAAGNRTKDSITGFGILDGYRGVLVRDDYGGYLSYDAQLAGVQQCLAHLYRYLDDTYAIDPASQAWTRQAGDALREAAAAVRTARAGNRASLGPALLARLRHSYDQAIAYGISVNLSRPWHKGKHPGLILASRLKRKAAQVWLFTTRFDVPATNNGSENAIRGYKLAAKISGCWRTLSTLQRHCRIRSYLTTARSHGHHPLAAIRDALTGNTWMPPQPSMIN